MKNVSTENIAPEKVMAIEHCVTVAYSDFAKNSTYTSVPEEDKIRYAAHAEHLKKNADIRKSIVFAKSALSTNKEDDWIYAAANLVISREKNRIHNHIFWPNGDHRRTG